MENSLSQKDIQDNTNIEQLKGFPYFISIQRTNKKIKIPCANEAIAKRISSITQNKFALPSNVLSQ